LDWSRRNKRFLHGPLVAAARSGIVDFFVTEETAWTTNVWIRPLLVRNVDRLMYKLMQIFFLCIIMQCLCNLNLFLCSVYAAFYTAFMYCICNVYAELMQYLCDLYVYALFMQS
jgi:hypothetical protein